jgi:hypothetical protein
MDSDEEWQNYNVEAEEVYSPVDDHCTKVAQFVTEHRMQLSEIEKAIAADIRQPGNHGAEPIFLHLQPNEKIELLDLVRTDSEAFDKVVTVLAHVCDEIEQLKMEAAEELCPGIAVFGDTPDSKDRDDSTRLRNGVAEKFMGASLKFFQRVSNFAERCNELVVNLVQQLASLWTQNFTTNFINVRLVQVVKSISDVLGVLITLDTVVKGNETIGKCWTYFYKMMDMVRTDREEYAVSDGQLKKMNRMLHHLKEVVFAGRMLDECIEQDFEDAEGALNSVVPNIRNNKVFRGRFTACFEMLLNDKMGMVGRNRELFERREIVGIYGTFALLHKLRPTGSKVDEKLFGTMWGLRAHPGGDGVRQGHLVPGGLSAGLLRREPDAFAEPQAGGDGRPAPRLPGQPEGQLRADGRGVAHGGGQVDAGERGGGAHGAAGGAAAHPGRAAAAVARAAPWPGAGQLDQH